MLASVTTLYEMCDYEPVFGTNSGCDRHFSGDNLIIQKERFLYVDRCQLQVGVHTAPSHWYSLWPGLSWCSVLHWELRIEWQQGMYVRNKQLLRLSLLRRQSDHTEGEVPVDCCSYRLVFTRLLLTGTLCGLVCRGVRFSTGSFGLNGSRECMLGTNSGCDCHFSGDNLIIQKERFL